MDRTVLPRTITIVSIIVASAVASLLLLEVGIRAYSLFFHPKMMISDQRLRWKHATNVRRVFVNEDGERSVVTQHANGHRGHYYAFTRNNSHYRILVAGDSFTEGVHVNEADLFTARLEALNPQLEVLNAGVGGYGTVQEYLYLSTEGLTFQPDLSSRWLSGGERRISGRIQSLIASFASESGIEGCPTG